jgi:hypothetical protein
LHRHADQKFPIGETVTVLCHFTNTAEHYPFNVTAIMGSLNSPFDFNFHVQNYSYKPLGVVVRPDEEFTFSYEFQVSEGVREGGGSQLVSQSVYQVAASCLRAPLLDWQLCYTSPPPPL